MSFAVPEDVAKEFGLMSGEEVAEFGTGIGAYTLACAKIVGGSGKIYAIDVQKDLLERLRNDAKNLGITNIEYIWGDIEEVGGTKLKDHLVDVVLMASVFFQLADKLGAVKEAQRLLRSGGRIVFIDWSDSFGGLGPKPEDVFGSDTAENLFTTNGFKKVKSFQAGDHHYGLIFQKQT
ncbi:MAG: methyltransferase domain-containing protein [Candidatus Paceibacterota bacterium]|jgi:ubiquinone/menaquinone biosynthesis C-methylase UbiE